MADTTYKIIKDKLLSVIGAIDKIQVIKGYSTLELSGYPAVTIYPSNQSQAEYDTTIDNKRYYTFTISAFYDLPNQGMETAQDALFDLVDDIMDALDDNEFLTGISLPADYTMVGIRPTFTMWGTTKAGDKELLVADVTAVVVVTHDIT